MWKKYRTKGYVIVHGQKILVISDIVHAVTHEHAVVRTREQLRRAFMNTGDVVEFSNCVFEKEACSGLFVDAEYIGNAYNIFQRFFRWLISKMPFRVTWK